MSKFNAIAIATRFVSYGNVNAQQRITRDQMRVEAATWTPEQKIAVDEQIVLFYAAKRGLSVHERKEPSAKGYCSLVIDFERIDGKLSKADNAANVAVSELRKIIFAVEAEPKAKKSTWVRVYDAAVKRADSDEAVTAAERKEIRAAMTALAALLA